MKLDQYTRTLESIAELGDTKEAEEAISKIINHLKSSGNVQMLPQIATELKKIMAKRKALEPVVEVAHESESAEALKGAEAAGISAPKAHVNKTLIKGWRVRGNGKLIDRSAKQGLLDIYQKVTH